MVIAADAALSKTTVRFRRSLGAASGAGVLSSLVSTASRETAHGVIGDCIERLAILKPSKQVLHTAAPLKVTTALRHRRHRKRVALSAGRLLGVSFGTEDQRATRRVRPCDVVAPRSELVPAAAETVVDAVQEFITHNAFYGRLSSASWKRRRSGTARLKL